MLNIIERLLFLSTEVLSVVPGLLEVSGEEFESIPSGPKTIPTFVPGGGGKYIREGWWRMGGGG